MEQEIPIEVVQAGRDHARVMATAAAGRERAADARRKLSGRGSGETNDIARAAARHAQADKVWELPDPDEADTAADQEPEQATG